MIEIKTEDDVHEVFLAVIQYYQQKHTAPAFLHILADVMYLAFGEDKCIDALRVVDNALVAWVKDGCPKKKGGLDV